MPRNIKYQAHKPKSKISQKSEPKVFNQNRSLPLSLSPPHSVQPDVSHWAERSEDLELHIFCQNMASNATTKLVKLTSNVHTTYREKYHLDARRVTCYTAVSQADWSLPLRRLVISST